MQTVTLNHFYWSIFMAFAHEKRTEKSSWCLQKEEKKQIRKNNKDLLQWSKQLQSKMNQISYKINCLE